MKVKLQIIALTATLTAMPCLSWEGVEIDSGNPIEIEKGNLVRVGEEIEYFDYEKGEYRTVTVDGISRIGSSVEIEATNEETGEMLILDMEDE